MKETNLKQRTKRFALIELLLDSGKTSQEEAAPLLKEADELVAIAVSSVNTARRSGSQTDVPMPKGSAFRTPRSAFER